MPMVLMLLTLLQGWAIAAPPPVEKPVVLVPYREFAADGSYCDWSDGHCGVTGRARIMKDITVEIFRKITEQEAADEGRRRLVKYLADLRIDTGSRLIDRTELGAALKKQLDALAPEATDTSRAVFEARLKLPFRGEDRFLALVLPAARPLDAGSPPTTPSAAEAPDQDASSSFSGLIVDARHLSAGETRPVPALLPKIFDAAGELLYSAASVDPLYAREQGVVAYMQWIHPVRIAPELVRHRPREGTRPLMVKAVSTSGEARCDLVVSASDATRVREAAAAGFLSEARVIILMPPAVVPPPTPVHRRALTPAQGAQPATDPH